MLVNDASRKNWLNLKPTVTCSCCQLLSLGRNRNTSSWSQLDVGIGHLIEHAVRVAAQARILVGAGCAARTNRDDAAVSSQIAERIQITIARCHKTDKERSDRDQAEHGVKIGLEFGFQNDL